ncbi:MAG TPA: hypothetical protein VGF33_03730 [Caulobacteraceae bacterium]|jgi:hypothetical protein
MDALTKLPEPVLIAIGLCLLLGVVWLVRRGRGSGGYAVWITVPFILIICGGAVWLVVRAIRFTGFDILH